MELFDEDFERHTILGYHCIVICLKTNAGKSRNTTYILQNNSSFLIEIFFVKKVLMISDIKQNIVDSKNNPVSVCKILNVRSLNYKNKRNSDNKN